MNGIQNLKCTTNHFANGFLYEYLCLSVVSFINLRLSVVPFTYLCSSVTSFLPV